MGLAKTEESKVSFSVLKCKICDYIGRSLFALKYHTTKVHTTAKELRPHACTFPDCVYRTKYKKYLPRHIRQCHDVDREEHKVQCDQCDYKTFCPSRLRLHATSHSDNRPFACDFPTCSFRTKRRELLRMHKEIHKSDQNSLKIFPCTFCDYRSRLKSSLRSHILSIHSKETPYACGFPECDYSTNQQTLLKAHSRRHNPDSMFVCDHPACEYRTIFKGNLKKHQGKHDPQRERKFQCSLCPKAFTLASIRNSHITSVHTKERTTNCELCDWSTWRSASDLKAHLRKVHGWGAVYEKYKCGVCDFSSTCKGTVGRHQSAQHSIVRCFKCNTCEFRTYNKAYLERHLWKCPGLPRASVYQCNLCKNKFCTEQDLKTHLKSVHRGEQPYKCGHCDYATDLRDALSAHVVKEQFNACFKGCQPPRTRRSARSRETQNEKRAFTCGFHGCNYTTLFSTDLRSHQRRHFPELKNLQCPMCPRMFYFHNQLNIHIREVHLGEKPFQCQLCQCKLSSQASLQSHQATKHKDFKTSTTVATPLQRVDYLQAAEIVPEKPIKITKVHACPFCKWTHEEHKAVVCHTVGHREAVVVLRRMLVM